MVTLQANNKIYAFPSFFVLILYPIGPAMSRPTTWKGVILLSCLFSIFQLVGVRKRKLGISCTHSIHWPVLKSLHRQKAFRWKQKFCQFAAVMYHLRQEQ